MPVRLGIVGADDGTLRQSKALAEISETRIVAVCDINAQRAELAAKRLNAVAFKDVKRLLESENVDALYIGAPPAARRSAEILAIARGCPVLLEMPLASNSKTLNELLRAAREHRTLVCPALPLRYARLVQNLQKILKARGGAPLAISVSMWNEAASLHVVSTHIVDVLRFCCGEVRAVTAQGKKIENGAAWTLHFNSGFFATLSLVPSDLNSGCDINVHTQNTRHQLTLQQRDSVWHQCLMSFLPEDETRVWTHQENAAQEMQRVFLNSVSSGRRAGLQSTLIDATKTWAVIDAAERSMKSGKTVRVAE